MNILQCELITETGYESKLPFLATKGAAAFDLFAAKPGEVKSRDQEMVCTGVKMKIPLGFRGIIKCRSGLAWKNKLSVEAGVIDADYRLEVKVILYNRSPETYSWKAGDRIAQIKLEQIPPFEIEQVDKLENEKDNDRKGGFGSTGV